MNAAVRQRLFPLPPPPHHLSLGTSDLLDTVLANARFASVDVTARCPSRCGHCYFFRNPPQGSDLPDSEFLDRLRAWKARTRVDCMLWLGGEPFLRTPVLREGARLFRRNAAFTGGQVPVPTDLPIGVMVSLDGPERHHDRLRGEGAFQRALESIGGVRDSLFHVTLTAPTHDSAPELAEFLHEGGAAGVVFGTYSPRVGETGPWTLGSEERSRALQMVQEMRRDYGSFVLNTTMMIDLMRSPWRSTLAAECPYRTGDAVALDHRLRVKLPCSYGAGADCSRCGCIALYLRAAAFRGDREAARTLGSFFQVAKNGA